MHSKLVSTWMTPSPITIGPGESITTAYIKMKDCHIRRLPVMDGEELVGVITVDDIRGVSLKDPGGVTEYNVAMMVNNSVADLMTSPAIVIAPQEHLGKAARLMMKHKISGLPVLEKGTLIGVISEADIFRLMIAESWSPLPLEQPNPDGSEVITLTNGEVIHIRPIQPDDAMRLQASLLKMSPETIYDRFMGYKKALADQEARYLTCLDYDQHMALVATAEVNGEEDIVGVARYHVIEDDLGSAEFAIIISDAYQRRKLGTHLMKRLMEYAQAHEISTFLGFAHEGNTRLLRFIQSSGLPIERKFKNRMWELSLNLKGALFSESDIQ